MLQKKCKELNDKIFYMGGNFFLILCVRHTIFFQLLADKKEALIKKTKRNSETQIKVSIENKKVIYQLSFKHKFICNLIGKSMQNVKNMVDKKKFSKASSMSDFFVLSYIPVHTVYCVYKSACFCVFRIKISYTYNYETCGNVCVV